MVEVYAFRLTSFDGNSEILTEADDAVPSWTLTTLPQRGLLGFLDRLNRISFPPGCTIRRTDGTDTLVVTRQRRFPLPRFVMTRDGEIVAVLTQRSPLLNRYALEFPHGETWHFQMPLFHVLFHGISEAGREIQVREITKTLWVVRGESGALNSEVLCGLGFIQRERWRAS